MTTTDNRRFWRILLLIVLGALALRVGYVMLAKRTEPLVGDQLYYNAQANTLARGHGFTDFRDGSQTAEHPPLTALALTPTSWVMEQFDEGGSHVLAQRLTMTVFGAAVVLVIGLLGRAVAGSRAGLLAAAIAALYPNLWINDGLVMSETLATLAVALAILLTYRCIRAPRPLNAVWVGLAVGLAMLARGARAVAAGDGAAGGPVPQATVVRPAVRALPRRVPRRARARQSVADRQPHALRRAGALLHQRRPHHLRRQPAPHVVRRRHRPVGARLRRVPRAEG